MNKSVQQQVVLRTQVRWMDLGMNWRRAVKSFAIVLLKALLICDIILLMNIIFVSALVVDAQATTYLVSTFMLLEGGIGLTAGGLLVVAAGPSLTKASQMLFHGKPYTVERYREREGEARLLFVLSALLMLIGYLLPV
jgi:hypothetical protein